MAISLRSVSKLFIALKTAEATIRLQLGRLIDQSTFDLKALDRLIRAMIQHERSTFVLLTALRRFEGELYLKRETEQMLEFCRQARALVMRLVRVLRSPAPYSRSELGRSLATKADQASWRRSF